MASITTINNNFDNSNAINNSNTISKGNSVNINNKLHVLTINDMSYVPKVPDVSFKLPKKVLQSELNALQSNSQENEALVTLLSPLTNALINKDNDSFIWCVSQNDSMLIQRTVMKMDGAVIKMFIEKVIELFQSSNVQNRNVLMWIKNIFAYHKYQIMSMDNNTIMNLVKVKNLIVNQTKHLMKLKRIKTTLDRIYADMKDDDEHKVNEDETNEAMLVYVESDDEEEKEMVDKKKRIMEEKGFVALEGSDLEMEDDNGEDEDEDVDEEDDDDEDYFDIDEDDVDINMKDDNVIKKKKKKNNDDDDMSDKSNDGDDDDDDEEGDMSD
jgi:hypothetical protein